MYRLSERAAPKVARYKELIWSALQTFRIFLMQALLDKSRVDMKLIAITPLM
jgi:3-deoxy-D-manno-octulosonic-acid transferase